MPAKVIPISKGRYKVETPHGTRAKSTTKTKAKAQQRLLNAIHYSDKSYTPPWKR